LVSLVTQQDFSTWKSVLVDATKGADGKEIPEIALKYGDFISAIINFVVIAFVMFLLVKAQKSAKLEAPAPAPTPSESLLSEIRDLLKK
jgi:large conductance mechanosensitive channel